MNGEDFNLQKDDNEIEFVTYAEGITKARQGGLRAKPRLVKRKMFANGDEATSPVVVLTSKMFSRHERNWAVLFIYY